jgi:hypothetical protein
MVEQIMFFLGGFLVAALLALILMPVVHARAVRLTTDVSKILCRGRWTKTGPDRRYARGFCNVEAATRTASRAA